MYANKQLTIKLRLLDDLYFSNVDIAQRIDKAAVLFNILGNRIRDPLELDENNF